MRYRSEIDGLRAVAVLPVILFHAGFKTFSGGFAGVDVFYVLSGYLITTLILEERAAGRFSLADFYARRARRILPALYVMVALSIPPALALMMPDELDGFFRTVVAVLFFASNFRLWLHTGYFQPDAELNPLTHTWSLAVEEQYYMLFPLGLLALWRFGMPRVALTIGLVSLASLGLAEAGWRHFPGAAFYLLPTRAWELGIGSLGALYLFRRTPAFAPWLAEAGASGGVVLILAAVFLFDDRTPFPGLYALVPTLGALAVILFAPRTLAGRVLSLPPFRFVGLISYSAYLWHQPLFAFARIGLAHPPGHRTMMALVMLSLAIAVLSWRLVEQPFRNPALIPSPTGVLAASTALLAGALVLPGMHRPAAAYPPQVRELVAPQEERNRYVLAAYDAAHGRRFTDDPRRKVLIIGDSHALDFLNMAHEAGAFGNAQVALSYVFSECQIYLGDADVSAFRAPSDSERCEAEKGVRPALTLAAQAETVIFVAKWQQWAAERLPETLRNFRFRPDQRVIVVGGKSFTGANLRRLVSADPGAFATIRAQQSGAHQAATRTLRRLLPATVFVDIHALVCGAGWDCPLFTPEGDLISYDGSHLTREGARYLGTVIFRDPLLALFAPARQADATAARAAGAPHAEGSSPAVADGQLARERLSVR